MIGALLALVAFAPLLGGGPVRMWLLAVAAGLAALAVVRPAALGPVNRLLARLGLVIGRVTNPVVMAVLFFAVVTPFAGLVRLFRTDPLRLRRSPSERSYWVIRTRDTRADSMKQQF
jgi:hypothetical protein